MDTPPVTEPHFPARLVLLADNDTCCARLQTGKDSSVIGQGTTIQAALIHLTAQQPVLLPPAPGLDVPLTPGHHLTVELRVQQPDFTFVFAAWWTTPQGRALHRPVLAATAPQAIADLLAAHPDPTTIQPAQPRLGGTRTPGPTRK
ncbi:hypothetical protei [Deinococcus grandis]|uniref:Hypothetical protei n=1 Tax=Deinococcus grandis TaxID=57498 RepID=A0A100HQA5_9DEIO|nr:hypothetical protein [Deinococcus grandis]BBN97036.1 hypothetical protein DEGR_37690 [Deinococcus grandis]GAQ23689.1 hypothetical protei [Deinococcus grandis]